MYRFAFSGLLAFGFAPLCAAADFAEAMLPTTQAPIVYTIDYSGEYFKRVEYLEQFQAAPPDLLHVGKAVPISHHWGPIRLYQGENQYTGGPGHTLSWENIALLSPDDLAARIETIRSTLQRYHAIGIREITPYISYHTLAGDHQKRLGFWKFYDRWDEYTRWAGPRPERDPFDWLVVDREGKFVGGSCGGYSPDYYAPLHRYRACINHPDWAEWHRRLIRMVAEVGYDGCFVDNTHPDPCYCRHCKSLFRRFLDESREVPWVRRLTEGLDYDALRLDSDDVPAELVRRWRVLCTGEHLGMLREAGRKVKPGFTIFPNSGRIDECLQVGARCDRLMFESTFSPGILSADQPPESESIEIEVSDGPVEPKPYTHRLELYDGATFAEMTAEITIPTRVRVGEAARLSVKILSVGASLADGDAAEEFCLLLGPVEGPGETRVELEPGGPVGGTGSSRKPRQAPAELSGRWIPSQTGRYQVRFGFRYTDESHPREASRTPHVHQLTRGRICRTHQAELLFSQHMHARAIYLGYEARRPGWENVQELSLAEMAAFSGGGGFSGRGEPQAKYRQFFKRHPDLFEGWRPTADAAVLFASWGPNPLSPQHPRKESAIQDVLGSSGYPFVALIDATLPESAEPLGRFEIVYLPSPRYELTPGQIAALRDWIAQGGRVVLGDRAVTINGRAAADQLAAVVWDEAEPGRLLPRRPVAPDDGLRRNVRHVLYRHGDRLALHAVHYNVCLLDGGKRVLEVGPTPLEIPLPDGWKSATAVCYDPDGQPEQIACQVAQGTARLTLPRLRIYKVVVLERVRD